jgi:thiol-disulfide isomerase/thioredoxin
MKHIIRFLVLLAFFACSYSVQSSSTTQLEDRWLRDAPGYERALQLQRELGVPLVVYFYADWCPYCRDLDSQYLPAPPVQEFLKGVVKVRINPEHGRPERVIADQFGVTGYPSFFVVRKPSSLPVKLNPFRRSGANLTPAEFASACARGTTASGLGSPIRVSRKPVPLANTKATATVSATPVARISNPDQPTINDVLNKYVQALGGRAAVARVTSRVTKGRVDIAGVSFGGKLETYAKAPNMALTVMTAEPMGVLKRGFDGLTAWSRSDQKDARQPSPTELAALADDLQLYRDIKLREIYPRMRFLDKGNVGTREVYILEAISRSGSTEKLYFEVESGLLLRRDTMRPSSRGPVQAEFYFSDWRDVDGIKLPFKTTERLAGTTYIFTLEEVRHNLQLDDEVFRAPLR